MPSSSGASAPPPTPSVVAHTPAGAGAGGTESRLPIYQNVPPAADAPNGAPLGPPRPSGVRAGQGLLCVGGCAGRFADSRVGSLPAPPPPRPKRSIRMAVNPPPPPDQRDHRGKKRNLPLGKSDPIFGTQTFGSQTPPNPPPLL